MNPQLGAALQNPQIRSMLSNPDILRQMADPAVLQVRVLARTHAKMRSVYLFIDTAVLAFSVGTHVILMIQ